MTAINFADSCLVSDPVIQRANVFAKTLPQSLAARKEGKAIILTFVKDEKLPTDKDKYGKLNIDPYAIQAYRKIFAGEDEIELLLRDTRLIFSMLFWNGQELSEMEFTYFMNDLIFLAESGC